MDKKANSFADALLRLSLRLIPILPAPELYDVIRSVRRSQDDVDKQVQEAVDALTRSSQLIDNLGKTLKSREEKLKELQIEYNRVSQLGTLTNIQAEAVAASLEKTLGLSQPKERWISLFINLAAGLIFFLVGVFASEWLKSLPTRFGINLSSPTTLAPSSSPVAPNPARDGKN